MRALSVRQPAAELIVNGQKPYEVRSWRTRFHGRILIHASLRLEPAAVAVAGFLPDELVRGALIGSVEIVGCVPLTPEMADEMRPSGSFLSPWQPELFAWVLRDPARLRQPVPFRGRLGFFDVPENVIRGVKSPGATATRPAHFVQYHNVEKTGVVCEDVGEFIVTNKAPRWIANNVIGNTVWLICGEGRPRRFSVGVAFTAEDIGESEISGFEYQVSGRREPIDSRPIDGERWFPEFMASQGNFAFGLNRIGAEFVPHFERLLQKSRQESPSRLQA
jgi:hypothetical protein